MSFDLAVWHEPSGITSQEAADRYGQLVQVEPVPGAVPGHPQVAAFFQELTAEYPDLGSLPIDDLDGSPWSAGLTVTDTAVLMSMSWSRVDVVATVVRKLADQHGLVLFDPQDNTVNHPSALRTGPTVVLSSCDGSQSDDPGPAMIEQTLRRLSHQNWFAVLERGEYYVQVGYGEQAETRPGWYALEHRDGSADRHFRTEVSDLSEVVTAFAGFARDEDAWRQRFSWRKADL